MTNYTIVTAFLDIGRSNWNSLHARSTNKYLENARRMLSLNDYMVIFIEQKFYNFVYECRSDKINITKIVVVSLDDLPAMQYYDIFEKIMKSDEYKSGLVEPDVPECTEPLYDIVMFSKTYFIKNAIENKYFQSTHYIWIDFGIHSHMLTDDFLNKKLFKNEEVRSEISFLCRSIPQLSDLNIKKFYKSHTVRLCGTLFGGSEDNLLLLHDYMKVEIENCIENNVIESDQALFNIVYLKHSHLFRLWFGNWNELIYNYCKSKRNLNYVYSLLNDCLMQKNTILYSQILSTLS